MVHAAALLEIAEPGSMDGYWDMITKIVKTYANWDRNDSEFPYLRTFSPWMGHSMASGLGNAIGNNRESSSEAMQSWAGMFMTAEMTENTDMRDAAAFGYLMESRAIADYWYNESGTFDEIGYEKPVTGILEMNRYVYGTFFGAQETYIHGIQWLPISPAYGFWNDFLTTNEAATIVDPIMNNMVTDLENGISADWMNVSMGFKLFFDPESVVNQFDGYWNADVGSNEYQVAHNNGENGLTYYYAHASQNIGIRQSDFRLTLPLSSAFLKNGEMTYVVYNPSENEQTCEVYQNNTFITSFDVPANTLITANNEGIIDGGTTPTSDNLALNGTASQSTTAHNGEALRAIDNNTSGVWGDASVTHTNSGVGEWWQVALDGTYKIGEIKLWNRTNCCMFRLDDITVTVEDSNENVLWSETIISSSQTTLTVNAGGISGSVIKITQNQNYPVSLAEVQVYEYDRDTSTPVFPDPTKTYYMDSPIYNLRIAAGGESEAPYTTTITTIDDDVAWQFVAKGNGYWHIQRAAGGTLPRLRTDNSEFADMQGTAWSGTYTYYELTEGSTEGTYFVTLPDGPENYSRLQVNNSGEVKMISPASTGTWESFTFTEIEDTTSGSSLFIEAEDYASMSGVQSDDTTDENGGKYMGWFDADDWLEYSVNIPSAGNYTIDYRLASAPGSTGFEFQVNGNAVTTQSVNATGDWDTWYTATSSSIYLSEGTQTIRLYAVEGSWNINWFEIKSQVSANSFISRTSLFNEIKLYPNPVANQLNINLINYKEIINVDIIDLKGKKVIENKIIESEVITFNTNDLSNGVYLVRVKYSSGVIAMKKFIK